MAQKLGCLTRQITLANSRIVRRMGMVGTLGQMVAIMRARSSMAFLRVKVPTFSLTLRRPMLASSIKQIWKDTVRRCGKMVVFTLVNSRKGVRVVRVP